MFYETYKLFSEEIPNNNTEKYKQRWLYVNITLTYFLL